MNNITISDKIKEYRTAHCLTQEQFGALMGVSPQAISKWEREECYPDITFLPALAQLLHCEINDFFSKDNP
ncbi:MAG: helix-turn-helix transcriptional regulator [Clostridia bacterium]|nr:helix-turn-helix transcriptional regulator [Clostridia bacterium]MBQ4601768.1 helix-turn-helix transcriptional regulator [Clostridia bacterium]